MVETCRELYGAKKVGYRTLLMAPDKISQGLIDGFFLRLESAHLLCPDEQLIIDLQICRHYHTIVHTINVSSVGRVLKFGPKSYGNPVRRLNRGFGSWMDVGTGGHFGPEGRLAGKLPFEIRNVQDLIDHYNEICAALGELADRPEALHFEDPDGSSVTYTIRR